MRIEQAVVVPARGGHYNEDLQAIRAGAHRDGYLYPGTPQAPGFDAIRQPSEAFSLILRLEGGATVAGDGMSVAYSAAGGRHGLFRAAEQLPHLQAIADHLRGRPVGGLTEMCAELEALPLDDRLHRNAAFYGASQALAQAVAVAQGRTAAEVLAARFGRPVATAPVAINVQCGDERHHGVDKAIMKRADVLPHGLINDLDVLGAQGERLQEYVSWIVDRIARHAPPDYRPELHIDVYGMVGVAFGHDVGRMADYLARLGELALPHRLSVETPVLMDSRSAQIETLAALREALAARGEPRVPIIVDEWANTLADIRAFLAAGAVDMVNVKSPDLGSILNAGRAILDCKAAGVRPILGGSCADTDQSARVIAHLALAAEPAWVLARPGMGIDEGMQIVGNEMARTLALIAARGAGEES
ncbi:MAG: methylaspartate ammonia-lyase [Spirochaetaceae bacterium]|nr:methylaspartate ammonia-lyase [Spirochaetaceae bacterium]